MPPLLEVRGLKSQFNTREGIVRAVDGVSFTLDRGETLGLVGESGCGKTVTGLSLMRLLPQPAGRIVGGEIIFDGQNLLALGDEAMRRVRGKRIAMVFQDPMTSLNPVLTIGRQITEALELHLGMSGRQARERAVELLQLVGIPNAPERLNQYPHHFSGGMRQRVMIAMAISCHPDLLIADEATTALDVTIQAQILDLLRRLQRELHMALVLITHDLGVVAGMADRVNVMYAGHIVEKASTVDIFERPRHPYTLGLLRSIPRIDRDRQDRLEPIGGVPPDLIDLPPGCPFAPRCSFAIDRCQEANPALSVVGENHEAACWVEVDRVG